MLAHLLDWVDSPVVILHTLTANPQRRPRSPSTRGTLRNLQPTSAPQITTKLLVIGAGGREHAHAWRLAQNPKVQHVFVAPGYAGMNRPHPDPIFSWMQSAQRTEHAQIFDKGQTECRITLALEKLNTAHPPLVHHTLPAHPSSAPAVSRTLPHPARGSQSECSYPLH